MSRLVAIAFAAFLTPRGAAVVSLVLTVLDLKAAFAGVLLNVLIIAIVWVGLSAHFHRG